MYFDHQIKFAVARYGNDGFFTVHREGANHYRELTRDQVEYLDERNPILWFQIDEALDTLGEPPVGEVFRTEAAAIAEMERVCWLLN